MVLDADGVLIRGREALPGVPGFFDFLREHHIANLIATNHSGRPASDVVENLARAGATIAESQVLTSAQATALSLPRIAPQVRRVLMIGGIALQNALNGAGYELVDRDADAVVVGIDMDLSYDKLRRATREIRRGALFLGTNADKTLPLEDGPAPGSGATIAALVTATDMSPIIIGKPERTMFDLAVEQLGSTPEVTATLGDRLDTDIEGGIRAGLKSILVLTGVTTRDMLDRSCIRPDWVFDDLIALRHAWECALT